QAGNQGSPSGAPTNFGPTAAAIGAVWGPVGMIVEPESVRVPNLWPPVMSAETNGDDGALWGDVAADAEPWARLAGAWVDWEGRAGVAQRALDACPAESDGSGNADPAELDAGRGGVAGEDGLAAAALGVGVGGADPERGTRRGFVM